MHAAHIRPIFPEYYGYPDLRALTEIWRGERRWPDAVRSGAVTIDGPVTLRRSLPGWFVSPLAEKRAACDRHATAR